MLRKILLLLLCIVFVAGCMVTKAAKQGESVQTGKQVVLGIERVGEPEIKKLLEGKRLGLFTNQTGEASELLKNFLKYIMTNEPVDEFTENVERQVAAVKNDKKAREEYMVLQAKIREHEILAFEAGEAKGHAVGLQEGQSIGEAKKSRETALKMLRKNKPLSEIIEFTDISEKDVLALAKENGLEVIA